jgi:beta-lactamase regulating signal transducer with metallopeptidase domain
VADLIAALHELLWRNAWAVLPLAVVVAVICRSRKLRPATRHLLCFVVLLGFFIPPGAGRLVALLPEVNLGASLPIGNSAEPLRERVSFVARKGTFDPITLPDQRGKTGQQGAFDQRAALKHSRPTMRSRPTVAGGSHEVASMSGSSYSGVADPDSDGVDPKAADSCGAKPVGSGVADSDPVVASRSVIDATAEQAPEPAGRSVFVLDQPPPVDSIPRAAVPLPATRSLPSETSPRPAPVIPSDSSPSTDASIDLPSPSDTDFASPPVPAGPRASGASTTQPPTGPGQPLTVWGAWLRVMWEGFGRIRETLGGLPRMPLGLWAGGGGLVLLGLFVRTMRYRRRVAAADPAPPEVAEAVRRAARRLGLSRMPETRMLPSATSPMIWCGRSPHLLLPTTLWEELSPRGREAILYHELAHLRRMDHWVCSVVLVATALYWWHPVLWWVRRRIYEEADLSCDAWVTWLMPADRRTYAEVLLQTRQFVRGSSAWGPATSMGAVTSRTRQLARRITMVMTQTNRPKTSHLGVVLACMLMIVGWIGAPAWACDEEKPAKPATPTKPAKVDAVELTEHVATPAVVQVVSGKPERVEAKRRRAAERRVVAGVEQRGDVQRQIEELDQQLEMLRLELDRLRGTLGEEQPQLRRRALVRPDRAPAVEAQRVRELAGSAARAPEAQVTRVYRLSKDKHKALQNLMVRSDVPIVVTPGEDQIIVHGTDSQQRVFGTFVELIDPEGKTEVFRPGQKGVEDEVYVLPSGKLEALTELMILDDVPVLVAPGDEALKVYGKPAQQEAFAAFVDLVHPKQKAEEVIQEQGRVRARGSRGARTRVEVHSDGRGQARSESRRGASRGESRRSDTPFGIRSGVGVPPAPPALPTPPTPPTPPSRTPGVRVLAEALTGVQPMLEDVEIVRSYELPKGKLELLNKLMLRDDVPVRVRTYDDHIEVHGNAEQHRRFRQFIELIHPEAVKDAQNNDSFFGSAGGAAQFGTPAQAQARMRVAEAQARAQAEQAIAEARLTEARARAQHANAQKVAEVSRQALLETLMAQRDHERFEGFEWKKLAETQAGQHAEAAQHDAILAMARTLTQLAEEKQSQSREILLQAEELAQVAEAQEEEMDGLRDRVEELREIARETQDKARAEGLRGEAKGLLIRLAELEAMQHDAEDKAEQLEEQGERLEEFAEVLRDQVEELMESIEEYIREADPEHFRHTDK